MYFLALSLDASSSFKSSSSSSFDSWLENLHPRSSLFCFPQHHHIYPPHSPLCCLQDQLKFSFSLYSFPQFLHVFNPLSNLPFLLINFVMRIFYLSRSSSNSLFCFSTLIISSCSLSKSSVFNLRSLSSFSFFYFIDCCCILASNSTFFLFVSSSLASSLNPSFSAISLALFS